jgi:hypothetical protein
LCEAYESLRDGLGIALAERYDLRSTARIAELLPLLEAGVP